MIELQKKRSGLMKALLWVIEGIIVGFGAIMPGISGGTLCVAFGLYRPIIGIVSHPKENIKKYGGMVGLFIVGAGIGFVGLSGLASWLMGISSTLVTCAFIGFIIGTFPELWTDAGIQGRTSKAPIWMCAGFAVMLCVLIGMRSSSMMTIEADFFGFLICGILWGTSFIVPGLSSSTLLLFFGLYQPMLDGIARLDMSILFPMAIGMALCVILLSKGVNMIYEKYYSQISHTIIGVVAATVVMIIPDWNVGMSEIIARTVCIVCGAFVSYMFSRICARLKKSDK